jgi:hypothetical protein
MFGSHDAGRIATGKPVEAPLFSPRSHEATKFPAQHLPAAVSSSQLRAFVVKKSGLTTSLTIPGKPESPGLFVAAYSPDCPGGVRVIGWPWVAFGFPKGIAGRRVRPDVTASG